MPTEEEIKLIFQAAPEAASVEPLKERKILVFSLAWGYKHSAVPWGIEAIKAMAEKSDAFTIVVSNELSMFETDNLQQFDAVVFNNTNEEIFLPENFKELSSEEQAKATKIDSRLKENLVNFLKSGKGLAVIHAGLAVFRDWPEYGNIIGGRFDNHPWGSGSTITVKVDEPDHPLNKAFREPFFEVTDEIYQVTGDYSRNNLRVLLSIDTARTDMTKETIHRTDGDFALSWIKNYGQGRVFYFAFGHDKQIYWNASLLRHLQDGIQFVAGDLICDTKPVQVTEF
jgi:type 1 glutamine amidotransferase